MNMKLRHIFRLLCLPCLLCCAASIVSAQQPATDKPELPKLGSIKGRVIGEDGQPLAGIPVMAIPIGARNAGVFAQGPGRQSGQPSAPSQATTDDDGNFEFTNLLPASYAISASVPGYVAPLPESEEESRTGIYLVGEFASITLVKGGVITGKVFNPSGEPVTGISVIAIRIGNLNGEPDELSLARGFGRNWRTDDQGVYRIYGLIAGTYIVQAGQLGQGGQPGRPGGPGGALSPFNGNAPTYYPSSARDAAIPLTIRPGYEASGIDIRYRAEKGRSVGGKAIAAKTTDNNDFSPTEIRLSVAGTDSVIATAIQAGRGQNPGFAFYGIPDGDYEISARRSGNRGESDSVSEARRFAVRGADVVGLQLTLTPLALLNGKVVIEKAAANSAAACPVPRKFFVQEITLAAQRDDAATGSASTSTARNGRLNLSRSTIPAATGDYVFRNLEAGRWRLLPQLPDDNWYVRSISSTSPTSSNNLATTPGGRKPAQAAVLPNLARNGAMLKSGEKLTGVIITIAEGAASLKGNLINDQGKNPGKRQIHLIPAEREFADEVLRYAQANTSADGAFHFKNLPPGRYWLLTKPVKELSAGAAVHLLAWDSAQRAVLRKEAEAAGNIVELAACQHIADHKLNIK